MIQCDKDSMLEGFNTKIKLLTEMKNIWSVYVN